LESQAILNNAEYLSFSNGLKAEAEAWFEKGFNIVAFNLRIDRDGKIVKRPLVEWREWNQRRQTVEEFESQPWDRADGFGVVCNLPNHDGLYIAVIDYDVKGVSDEARERGAGLLKKFPSTRAEGTISGGEHRIYLSRIKPRPINDAHDSKALELIAGPKICIVFPSKGYRLLNQEPVRVIDDIESLFMSVVNTSSVEEAESHSEPLMKAFYWPRDKAGETPPVKAFCGPQGWTFLFGDRSLGPYWGEPPIGRVAQELGVTPKIVYDAILESYQSPLSLDGLAEILETTIKRDRTAKLITFLGMLLTQTEQDQINIAFSSESSTGKSYIPLEIMEYYPEGERIILAGASPTAFFHEVGEWDEERKVIRVNLEKKILIFLDQPHWTLMERMRPMLSHDRKILTIKITDKKERRGLITKTVELIGYPTVIFCTTRTTTEEQEKSRFWILSPEVTEEKIREGLDLLAFRESNRSSFKKWLEEHPQRKWLKMRVEEIRKSRITEVEIPESNKILERFLEGRKNLQPRHLRDLPRLLRLIKAIALLNCFSRAKADDHTIIAEESDVEEGLKLYEEIAESNELGLPPTILEIYKEVIYPNILPAQGITRKEILQAYRKLYFRPLSLERLNREIIPALESSGLIIQEPDPNDKRIMRIHLASGSAEENE